MDVDGRKMCTGLSLRMKTTLYKLPRISTEIEEFARGESWSPRLEFQIKLAIEEVVANVLNHGHEGDGGHEVEIKVASAADKIEIEITDDGLERRAIVRPRMPPSGPTESRAARCSVNALTFQLERPLGAGQRSPGLSQDRPRPC